MFGTTKHKKRRLRWLGNSLKSTSNSHEIIFIVLVVVVGVGLFLAVWDVLKLQHAFDIEKFGNGFGWLLGGVGLGYGAKKFGEAQVESVEANGNNGATTTSAVTTGPSGTTTVQTTSTPPVDAATAATTAPSTVPTTTTAPSKLPGPPVTEAGP
jgi:hypothetical protein